MESSGKVFPEIRKVGRAGGPAEIFKGYIGPSRTYETENAESLYYHHPSYFNDNKSVNSVTVVWHLYFLSFSCVLHVNPVSGDRVIC